MEKMHVLINPASRSGYSLKIWEKLAPAFAGAGWECSVYYSSKEESLESISRRITADGGAANLLVLGGDGTLNEVLNGIADFDRTCVGYIPIGSSNDYARAVGMKNWQEAAEPILSHKACVCRDLGEAVWLDPATGQESKRYFNVSAGMGFDAASCEGVDRSRFKKVLNRLHLGKLIYLGVAVRLILSSRLYPFDITVKRGREEEKMVLENTLFAVCMNYPYEGGGFMFCPRADAGDGKIDLCAASDIGRLRFFALFPTAYSGNHVKYPGITIAQGDEITIRTPSPVYLHTDGEVLGLTDMLRVKVHKGKIRFLN